MTGKLVFVVCFQAVLLKAISAQAYGSIISSNCGCSNAVPTISVSNCGCSNAVPTISVSNSGCSNAVPTISVSNCGCSNAIPVSVPSYVNTVSNVGVPSCGCSSSNYGFSTTTTASTGGPLSVTCYGPLSTNGVSVLAELGIQGDVDVFGTLPFLSAVVLEGTLPTSGVANVNYGCGDGNIAILQENGNPNGRNAASSSGLSLASLGAGSCGCRC